MGDTNDLSDSGAPPSVLHVVDTLDVGGLERVVTDLALAQRAAGQRVAVFSIQACGGFRAELEAAGIPVVVGAKRGALDRRVLRALRATVREYGIQLVHSHNFVPNYYAALALVALRPAPALVNTVHNMGTRLANRRLRWLYRASLWRTRRVAMVGTQVRDRLVGRGFVGAGKAEVVFNGIPFDRFAAATAAPASARAALGIAADALVAGCVGRLVPVKNHALLLECLPWLRERHPRLHVVLAGDGPLEDELRRQAAALGMSDHVTIGSRGDVAAVLPAYDVYVQPSLSEGLSIALLEAAAARRAIVATAVGGNPEIVEHGSRGLLVAPGDGEALREAIDRLLADAARREQLGANAQDWARANASLERMRDAYAALYARALCRPVSSHGRANA